VVGAGADFVTLLQARGSGISAMGWAGVGFMWGWQHWIVCDLQASMAATAVEAAMPRMCVDRNPYADCIQSYVW
jgi:phosphatidylethanolamine-binding protein (PEBP) family uncharacterized protein